MPAQALLPLLLPEALRAGAERARHHPRGWLAGYRQARRWRHEGRSHAPAPLLPPPPPLPSSLPASGSCAVSGTACCRQQLQVPRQPPPPPCPCLLAQGQGPPLVPRGGVAVAVAASPLPLLASAPTRPAAGLLQPRAQAQALVLALAPVQWAAVAAAAAQQPQAAGRRRLKTAAAPGREVAAPSPQSLLPHQPSQRLPGWTLSWRGSCPTHWPAALPSSPRCCCGPAPSLTALRNSVGGQSR